MGEIEEGPTQRVVGIWNEKAIKVDTITMFKRCLDLEGYELNARKWDLPGK